MEAKYQVRMLVAGALGVVGLVSAISVPVAIAGHLDAQQESHQLASCAKLITAVNQSTCVTDLFGNGGGN